MLHHGDGLLRGEGIFASDSRPIPWKHLGITVVLAGSAYGLVMGSFDGRLLQAVFSGLKVPILVAISTIVCLPNFFVAFNLLGLREDFGAAVCGIVSAQATFALTLVSLAPLTAFCYVSEISYNTAKVVNVTMFAIACVGAQITLGRHFRPLIRKDPRHRRGLMAWFGLYTFVAVQLAWVLRPFIGSPDIETRLFRESAWGNAYVELYVTIARLLGGG